MAIWKCGPKVCRMLFGHKWSKWSAISMDFDERVCCRCGARERFRALAWSSSGRLI